MKNDGFGQFGGKPFDKETKALLLAALQRGHFTDDDFKVLGEKGVIQVVRCDIVYPECYNDECGKLRGKKELSE